MEKEDAQQLVLTVMEISKLLRCSKGAAYSAIRKGLIPSLRFGRKILIPRAALEKLLDSAGGGEHVPGRSQ